MKKILALTDFSDNAQKAAQAAVTIAGKLHANIILLNTFVSQPALSEYGGSPWSVEQLLWADEGKEKLAFLKEDLQESIQQLQAGNYYPSIDDRQEVGSVSEQVKELLQTEKIEMIVIGGRNGTAWEHLLMGSDTNAVINHTDRPVLIVPASQPLKKLKKVTLASDFGEADLNAVHYLTRLGRVFDLVIEIVHVTLYGEEAMSAIQKANFKKHVAKYNYPAITYQEIIGKDLVNRLNHLCEEEGTDLLALVHDRHSFLNRLFKQNNAETLMKDQALPVLIIPAGISDK
ncbi:universal stress protein [Mucilaginibacter boryungensis]|uniref:Universal stress protein n=1 Tax=Mucilaginibacter boryungensis TaxID=768480 RepID=A0ABR9XET4_9SPHI|nr:universal stress protein [Mucilaginibacter boryungensis]MBE9665690.1 universal stress protein [Mucilaginibacter boryungensis]